MLIATANAVLINFFYLSDALMIKDILKMVVVGTWYLCLKVRKEGRRV